ncbi:ASST-domain-containing protein [Aspergillus carlsbadensis]|nr:ASST-domain-containing protein [Aspergillus carlsbadensis]
MATLNWGLSRHRRVDSRQFLIRIVLCVLITGLLYLFYVFAVPQLFRFRFRDDLSWYDLGAYGFGPSRGYVSFQYESPVVEITAVDDDRACDSGYTFLSPRGDSVANPGPMIFDADGELVWLKHNWETTHDFKVQRFQGEEFLTYWEGEQVEGRGYGSWYMVDSTYTIRYVINPVGSYGGDLHDFQITSDGTALVTIYDPIVTDLRSVGGPELGWIYDCLFQEFNMATEELIFEWRASDKFPINSTYETLSGNTGNKRDSAFDFFHINSVDKDDQGNYIISSRHTHAIFCISRSTGDVLWTLGGKDNEFNDLSNGEATGFSWQHDARWHVENSTITLFDNAAHAHSDPERESRGMAIHLDIPTRQATVLATYQHPHQLKSVSQGNVQLLEDIDRVLVGWGHGAAYSEFSTNGELLCNVHFGASAFFDFGRVVSYRAFKGNWVGNPQTRPDAVLAEDGVYVSWNGATEVVGWRLEAWEGDDTEQVNSARNFTSLGDFEKTGFETIIPVPDDPTYPIYRLAALDAEGNILGTTELLQSPPDSGSFNDLIVGAALVMGICGLVAAIYQAKGFCKCRRSCLKQRDAYELVPQ